MAYCNGYTDHEESQDKKKRKKCGGSLSLLVLSPFSQSFSKTGQRGLWRRLVQGVIQWNLDITKGQGTGKICSL